MAAPAFAQAAPHRTLTAPTLPSLPSRGHAEPPVLAMPEMLSGVLSDLSCAPTSTNAPWKQLEGEDMPDFDAPLAAALCRFLADSSSLGADIPALLLTLTKDVLRHTRSSGACVLHMLDVDDTVLQAGVAEPHDSQPERKVVALARFLAGAYTPPASGTMHALRGPGTVWVERDASGATTPNVLERVHAAKANVALASPVGSQPPAPRAPATAGSVLRRGSHGRTSPLPASIAAEALSANPLTPPPGNPTLPSPFAPLTHRALPRASPLRNKSPARLAADTAADGGAALGGDVSLVPWSDAESDTSESAHRDSSAEQPAQEEVLATPPPHRRARSDVGRRLHVHGSAPAGLKVLPLSPSYAAHCALRTVFTRRQHLVRSCILPSLIPSALTVATPSRPCKLGLGASDTFVHCLTHQNPGMHAVANVLALPLKWREQLVGCLVLLDPADTERLRPMLLAALEHFAAGLATVLATVLATPPTPSAVPESAATADATATPPMHARSEPVRSLPPVCSSFAGRFSSYSADLTRRPTSQPARPYARLPPVDALLQMPSHPAAAPPVVSAPPFTPDGCENEFQSRPESPVRLSPEDALLQQRLRGRSMY